jgi:preprotein translocase subunit SecE
VIEEANEKTLMAGMQVETVGAGAEKAKIAGAIALVVASLAAYLWLGSKGAWVQWGVLLLGLALATGLFFMSITGRRLVGFGHESWREVKKVVWPERKEATQITLYVFGFVLLMAIFLWLTDKSIEYIIYDLILGWRS